VRRWITAAVLVALVIAVLAFVAASRRDGGTAVTAGTCTAMTRVGSTIQVGADVNAVANALVDLAASARRDRATETAAQQAVRLFGDLRREPATVTSVLPRPPISPASDDLSSVFSTLERTEPPPVTHLPNPRAQELRTAMLQSLKVIDDECVRAGHARVFSDESSSK